MKINLGRVVGESAYEIAVRHGFKGSEEDWLTLLGKEEVIVRVGDYKVPHFPVSVEVTASGRIFLRERRHGNGMLNVNTAGKPFIIYN